MLKKRLLRAPRFAATPVESGSPPQRLSVPTLYKFLILVPAHNEEVLIDTTLKSIEALNYPHTDFKTLVAADNCTDLTAEIALARGAYVAFRTDTNRPGKGYLLEDAIDALLSGNCPAGFEVEPEARSWPFDALVIVDADTVVHPDLLSAFCAGLANGSGAMQGDYGVLNPLDSVRTRLMTCALALVHYVKPAGRERLRLSDGLRGTGMCLSRETLTKVRWSGKSITEDIEYSLRLCEAGVRIAFVPEARVLAQMPVTGSDAASQRIRWESGRRQLVRKLALPLLFKALMRADIRLMDRTLELLTPPFAELAAIQLVMLALCACGLMASHLHFLLLYSAAWCVLLTVQALYLFAGLWIAMVPASIAVSVLYAPVYTLWKLALRLRGKPRGWVRTQRRI